MRALALAIALLAASCTRVGVRLAPVRDGTCLTTGCEGEFNCEWIALEWQCVSHTLPPVTPEPIARR